MSHLKHAFVSNCTILSNLPALVDRLSCAYKTEVKVWKNSEETPFFVYFTVGILHQKLSYRFTKVSLLRLHNSDTFFPFSTKQIKS